MRPTGKSCTFSNGYKQHTQESTLELGGSGKSASTPSLKKLFSCHVSFALFSLLCTWLEACLGKENRTQGPAAPPPLFWGLCLLDVGLRQSRGAKVSSRRGGAAAAPAPRLASHAPTPELCARKVRPEPPGSAGSQPCSHLPGPHSFSLGEVGNLPFFLSQQQIFSFLSIPFFFILTSI